MMRYRIVIEIDAVSSTARAKINEIAVAAADSFTTKFSNVVFLSTEKVESTRDVLKS
jgi:hypothetical protein